jgi:hypothetical protein
LLSLNCFFDHEGNHLKNVDSSLATFSFALPLHAGFGGFSALPGSTSASFLALFFLGFSSSSSSHSEDSEASLLTGFLSDGFFLGAFSGFFSTMAAGFFF